MITPTHDDVHPPFGPLFTRNFLVKADEYAGIAEILGQCTARSTMIGDTMNRWCAPRCGTMGCQGNRGCWTL